MPVWVLTMMLAARIYVADSGENKITVIDPGKPAAAISVSAFPQGIVYDGRRLYVSSAANVLDVIDPNMSRLIRSVPLSPKPGCVTISPDGRYVYVCIGSRPIIEAVDTASLMRVKTIETSGVPHSINVTPDNTRMLIGYPGGIDVINVRTGEKEFEIPVTGTPASIAIESDRHLAIRRLFIHMAGVDGFEILDYASRKVTGKVALPSANVLAVSPDRRTLWATAGDSVVVFGLPDLKRQNAITIGAGAGAIVFEADGKHVWISNPGANSVVEIDTTAYKAVAHFPTGKAPGQMIAVE
jgi:YVTN family beta-propeller protein